MKASIVIPAHNEEPTLASCLQAVLKQTEPLQDYEIIVVDDGSNDNTNAIAVAAGVRVLEQSHLGAAAARNIGLHHAQGEIILFLDADCIPVTGWLTAMLAPFADPEVIGVSGRIVTQQKALLPLFIQLEYDQRFQRLEEARHVDFITSATGAYRRDVLLEMGGFCEDFLGAEDAELSFRIAEKGGEFHFSPDAVVSHVHPVSLFSYAKRKQHYAYWRMQVYERFKGKIITDSRTPQSQKLQLVVLGLLAISLVAGIIWSPLFWISAFLVVIYAIMILPTVRFMLRHNFRVGLISPLFLFVGAVAGALGVGLALLHRFTSLKHSDGPS